VVNPENTFFSVKRFIGCKMAELNKDASSVPYAVRTEASRSFVSPLLQIVHRLPPPTYGHKNGVPPRHLSNVLTQQAIAGGDASPASRT
jgi:hypothetical protein